VKSSISSAFVDSSSAGSDPLSAIEGQNEAAPRRSPARAKSSGEIPPDAFAPVVLELFLYLTGVPEKDVSSDLWREQVSITGGEYGRERSKARKRRALRSPAACSLLHMLPLAHG
jgi:hypothetical protein